MPTQPSDSTRRASRARTLITIAVVAAVGLSAAVYAGAPQSASATVRAGGASYSKTTVITKKITRNFNNLSKQPSACTVGTTGSRCSSTDSRSYTNTGQTSLGLSAKVLATNLGLSYAKSTAYSTTCTSPVMKKDQTWRMYPKGTKATYKIRKLMATQFRTTTTTSGTLTSLKADRNAIYYVIR